MTFKQSPPGFVDVGGRLIQKVPSRLNSLEFDAGAVDGSLGSWNRQSWACCRTRFWLKWYGLGQFPQTAANDVEPTWVARFRTLGDDPNFQALLKGYRYENDK